MTEQKTRYPSKLEVQQKVQNAIERLLIRDCYLLKKDVNERSISHRLASYLQDEFGEEWDVDCEYNRDHNIKKELIIQPTSVAPDDTTATTVFPDIIVHRRGQEDNLLVIEMKKTRNSQRGAKDFDLEKLRAFRQEKYHYYHTFYLQLKTGDDIGVDKMQWDSEWMTPQDDPLGGLLF